MGFNKINHGEPDPVTIQSNMASWEIPELNGHLNGNII